MSTEYGFLISSNSISTDEDDEFESFFFGSIFK